MAGVREFNLTAIRVKAVGRTLLEGGAAAGGGKGVGETRRKGRSGEKVLHQQSEDKREWRLFT